MLNNNASGPEIGLPGHMLAGLLPRKPQKSALQPHHFMLQMDQKQVADCTDAMLQAAALTRLQTAKLEAEIQSLVSTPVRGVIL